MDYLVEEGKDQEIDLQQERTIKDTTMVTMDQQAEDIDSRTIITRKKDKKQDEVAEYI